MNRFAALFWSKVQKCGLDGCWEWTGARDRDGYGRFGRGIGRPRRAHRISWVLHHGPIPDGLWVLHRCDNPPCVRPDHLFLGDVQANVDDMVAKGRKPQGDEHPLRKHPELAARGEGHGCAKLNEAAVVEIRRRRAAGETLRALATEYAVSMAAIWWIVRGKHWAHVPMPAAHDDRPALPEAA